MSMAQAATRKSTGLKRTASAASGGRSNANSSGAKRRYPFFVICIDNRGYEGSLMLGKAYKVIKPLAEDPEYDLRVIDEEGEDYLYSARRFVPVDLPPAARRAVVEASSL